MSSICPSLRASALVHSPISYSRSTRPSLKSRCSVISEYAESTQSEREESNIGSIGLSNQLIGRHFVQKDSLNLSVHFDAAALTQSNGKIIAVSSHPLKSGTHEWTVEIMECDVDIQELGVCSVVDIGGIELDDIGVTGTAALGARGLYGNALATGSVWYASYNEDAVRRCFKDLKSNHHIGWTCTDQIKVEVDLDKWRIKFFMNGQRVRKVLSLQPDRAYYPFISFAGNCQYRLC